MISLSRALDLLSKGMFLPVVVVGYNRSTGKAGEIRRVKGRLLARYSGGGDSYDTKGVKEDRIKRNANHYENATRDLQLENGSIMRIHIYLLVYVDGKKVM